MNKVKRILITLGMISLFLDFGVHELLADDTALDSLCAKVDKFYKLRKWNKPTCADISWKKSELKTSGQMPLIYAEFGRSNSRNKTLIFSAVHPNEVTPIYVGFELIHWLRAHENSLGDAHVIVAPIVNPDGMFKLPPSRVNGSGVDVNRNFKTLDWTPTFKSKRQFPGKLPNSEAETLFQIELIHKLQPTKILSLHSPLNHFDYDGPGSMTLEQFSNDYVQNCNELKKKLKLKSTGFFPGSLGNFAGFERGIPTVTLELPSIDASLAEKYWQQFMPGIRLMLDHRLISVEEISVP